MLVTRAGGKLRLRKLKQQYPGVMVNCNALAVRKVNGQ